MTETGTYRFDVWMQGPIRAEVQPLMIVIQTSLDPAGDPRLCQAIVSPNPPDQESSTVYLVDQRRGHPIGSLEGFIVQGLRVLNDEGQVLLRGFGSDDYIDAACYRTDDEVYCPLSLAHSDRVGDAIWTNERPLVFWFKSATNVVEFLNMALWVQPVVNPRELAAEAEI